MRPRAAKEELPAADDWVRTGKGAEAGSQKRLTLNLPAGLHAAFKSRCATDRVTIQDKVVALIERFLAEATPRPPEPPTEDH